MELIAQINTGGFHNTTTNSLDVIAALENLNVSKIIIGWSFDRDLYEDVISYCKKRNIESYLWIPIFSEIGSIKNGFKIKGQSGQDAKSYSLSEDEDFTFYCVNQRVNIDNVFSLFEEKFSGLDFTGVFIDKIRYPSFANGLDGVISCFCDECKKKGNNFDNLTPSTLLSSIISYENNEYRLNDNSWDSFFKFKAKSVYESLIPICSYFRNKGLKIGMDVYAPFMSYFVGQNIKELSSLADFVKPMMYADTFAPAGLPFELSSMLKELGDSGERFKEIIGYNNEDFLTKEIQNLVNSCSCDVFVGIEVNRTNPIAMIYPEHIKKNIKRYKNVNISGFVLSWNILAAPEENINIFKS